MDKKYKILLTISWYSGLVPLVGGWLIFLTWLCARYFSAIHLDILEAIGFLWILIFFWVSIIGLLLLLVYTFINRGNLHLKMLFTGLLILSNIPSVLIIVPWQGRVDDKVFVKLTNDTDYDNLEINLKGKLKNWTVGKLNSNESKVFNYAPPYLTADARQYQTPDTLVLVIEHKKFHKIIGFPTLHMGECAQLTLTKDLTLKNSP